MVGAATPEKVRVVVGDDHPLFREGVVRALSLSGSVNVVGEADDGSSALELIKTHKPDVALLDYRMPGMDGAQVAAAVRSYDLPTRVLLISAHDEAAIVYCISRKDTEQMSSTMRAPSATAAVATAFPIPVAAPTMTSRLPFSRILMMRSALWFWTTVQARSRAGRREGRCRDSP